MIKNKKIIIASSVILLIAVAGFFIYKYKVIDNQKLVDNTSKTTSNAPSAQSDFEADENREPTQSPTKTDTSVSDTGGSAQVQSNPSPLVSKDGVITVNSPTNNSVFTSGSSLVGKASVSKVSYRLIDDLSGVTATGDLSVVNGSFSGKFSFSTKATQGRLDVFQIGAGGVEKSIIEIPVRFR